MGHRPQDIAPNGLPVRLKLNGVFFLAELGVELIELLGVLLPLGGLHRLHLHPGGEGAHHHRHGHHAEHGHRVPGVAEGEGVVGVHKEVVDEKAAEQGGRHAVEVPVRHQGDEHDRQGEHQVGVVLLPGVLEQKPAEPVGGHQEHRRGHQVPEDRREKARQILISAVQLGKRLSIHLGVSPLPGGAGFFPPYYNRKRGARKESEIRDPIPLFGNRRKTSVLPGEIGKKTLHLSPDMM